MHRERSGRRVRNSVVRRLQAGDGSIAGMEVMVPIDNRCLMAAEVVGIDFA